MRCHVHGKLEHAGVPVDFSISLNAITAEAAVFFVYDLFQGPLTAIEGVEITDVDVDEDSCTNAPAPLPADLDPKNSKRWF